MCWFQSNGLDKLAWPSCHLSVDQRVIALRLFTHAVTAPKNFLPASSTPAVAFEIVVSVVSWPSRATLA